LRPRHRLKYASRRSFDPRARTPDRPKPLPHHHDHGEEGNCDEKARERRLTQYTAHTARNLVRPDPAYHDHDYRRTDT